MHAPASPDARSTIRPFLKWAGGKRQLLGELRRFVPPRFGAYHEPFLGSGALFFDLWRGGILAGHRCTLSDVNADLVGCYQALSRDVEAVIRELRALERAHLRGGESEYYRVRDERFNPRRLAAHAVGSGYPSCEYPAVLAAMFIYLNRTGYNGLFRLNARGEFNVPAGRYARPRICDEATLRAAAAVLATPGVLVRQRSYAALEGSIAADDFVYFDPPYVPLSATASFTSYTAGHFSLEDQHQLRDLVVRLAARGCLVVLSNSAASAVTRLYDTSAARGAGLRLFRVSARRAINSHAGRRGSIDEYVISNVRPQP
jgi:DNA adenine methylase